VFKAIEAIKATDENVARFQANVKAAFAEFTGAPSLPVQVVQSSASVTTYVVKPSDVYLVVNARGGPMKIVLPAPGGATQSVAIKNAYTGGAVSIVQSDGKPMGDGAASIGLPATESVRMVNDGKAWFSFGAT
jgi:hypothetical protein